MTSLFYFNPSCEISVLKGQKHFTPSKAFIVLQEDLYLLMYWLLRGDDILYTNQVFSDQLKKSLLSLHKGKVMTSKEIKEDKQLVLDTYIPWGDAPNVEVDLKNIKHKFKKPKIYNEKVKAIYHRMFGFDLLKKCIDKKIPNVISLKDIGGFYTEKSKVLQSISNLFKEGAKAVVLKLPFSSSGRGLLVLRREEITKSVELWVESGLKGQGSIYVSPWLDKTKDISFLFSVNNRKITYQGSTVFSVSSTGQYQGATLTLFENQIPFQLKDSITSIIELLLLELNSNDLLLSMQGNIGIDAMLYTTDDGIEMIHPCLEINPRNTMGHVALALQKVTDYKGQFSILSKLECPAFDEFEEMMKKEHPLEINNRKIEKGFFPLTDVQNAKQFYAYILVE
ncbi:hypothetical protein [Flammeovirga kamogawensis]|uniref:ATP-grasp domain-containing protein n=1 Tax=Flammeovirga kamogawensis TaxID=373891 RepID=A0ABX8GXX3_9BACT|nr:hypothetical protein [Flammeovirga kamogawensis]MBB6460908.1 hypothetical protein [Flammeovirga kamogawensis]QWG08253.1 hypothetical protein KM029_04760 [Flammeovirga kamogawensis]TRX70056.1 hypothetical protein EO216_18695 [Flammeovirga kamogawensis]